MGEQTTADDRARIRELELKLAAAEARAREFEERCAEQKHRVRNALQALSLLISAQARNSLQPELCMRCISRIASVCELNEALCGGEDAVSAAEFLSTLSRSVQQAFGDKAQFEVLAENVRLDLGRARRLGLIFSEAAMNALKHGFRGSTSGTLRTTFRSSGSNYELIIDDNGTGYDPGTESEHGHGRGFMKELALQLEGELTIEKLQPGCRVRLVFPADGHD